MSAIVAVLLWCAFQVTVLAVVAGGVYWGARRIGPALGAFVAFVSMLLVTAVTVLAFSPWPSWLHLIQSPDHAAASPATESLQLSHADSTDVSNSEPARSGTTVRTTAEATWADYSSAFWNEVQQLRVSAADTQSTWNWPKIFAAFVLVSIAAGSVRLAAGLISVSRLRRASCPITDAGLGEMMDILAAELGCTQPIELRECTSMTGAATFGWRRPVVLLSPEWREWSEEQRRAVLAHEMAHIHNRDYLTWLMAQVGLVLHFYHPLAHCLCRCLRMDQELVADSVAAGLSGGRQCYLQSLAHIALKQADVTLSWPASAFLPTRRTFLRRIDMLRNSKSSLARMPAAPRWIVAALLVLAGLAVVGIRDPGGMLRGVAGAQDPDKPKPVVRPTLAGQNAEPFKLSYVPRDAMVVIAIRPTVILSRPALQTLAQSMQNPGIEQAMGIRPDKVEGLCLFILPPGEQTGPGPIATVIRTVDAESAKLLGTKLAPHATKDTYAEQEYYRQDPGGFYFLPDDRTIVYTQEEGVLRRSIVAGKSGAASTKWAAMWATVAKADAAALINTTALRGIFSKGPAPMPPQLAAFAPLWEKTEVAVASLEISDTISLRLTAKSANVEDAQRARDTLSAVVITARNMLAPARDAISRQRDKEGPLLLSAIDIADGVLENVKIEPGKPTDPQIVATVTASADDTVKVVKIMTPAVGAARESARRMQDMNNMKQIALAFHNFHDTYRHFPPAVLYSPNNVPRSWRVEILPYLDQLELYKQYRQDEPWDSENNKQVLAKIPAVYRNPTDDPASTNSSYFGLTGEGTIFDNKEGADFATIVDGTSNTLMIVEAKRSIPWTKPEDIPYVDGKPLPKLGGWHNNGFLVAMCDGSVRFISNSVDERILRLLILKGDGQPIPPFDQ